MNEEIEKRCEFYGTTFDSCKCLGFEYKKDCKHVRYLRMKENAKIGLIEIEDGTHIDDAEQKYGEEWIDGMVKRGEIIIDRATGLIKNLR